VALRYQLNVLQRKAPKRLAFNNFDGFVFASFYRFARRCGRPFTSHISVT
jgi:hypothetical protein